MTGPADLRRLESQRWALLCGAAGGIGQAIATRLHDRGLKVVGVDRRRGPSRAGIEAIVCDLADEHRRTAAVADLLDRHGAPATLVWAAGTYHRRPIADYDAPLLQEVLDDNLTAPFFVVRQILPAMLAAGEGRIVLVGSQAAATGGLDPGYAAAKAGLAALAKSVAREHAGDGVCCNVVSPGPTETPMTEVMGSRREHYEQAIPLGRFSLADEVAEVVQWLALAEGQALTGATIDVDGGLLRR